MNKINAVSRITLPLRKFVSNLNKQERSFLFYNYMHLLSEWLLNGFATHENDLKKINPKLALGAGARLSAAEYKDFLIASAHLRSVSPPTISGQIIYRQTGIKEYPSTEFYIFSNTNNFRSATSWTILSKPKIIKRIKNNWVDIILEYKLEGTRHVLFDYRSIKLIITTFLSDLAHYRDTYAEIQEDLLDIYGNLNYIESLFKRYAAEKEVIIYLNKGESLECKWRRA